MVVIASRVTEKIANLVQLLADSQMVLFISPLYETTSGLEAVPKILGVPSYTNKNIQTYFGQFGVHMSQFGKVTSIFLHSFQFFMDQNQTANEHQLKLPFTQMLQQSTVDNGAEIAC